MTIIEKHQAKLAEVGIVEELPIHHALGHEGDPCTLLDVLALLADATSDDLWRLLLAVRLWVGSFCGFLGRD
jgi:hypothetical protein